MKPLGNPIVLILYNCIHKQTLHQFFAIMMQRIVFLHNFGPGYHESVLRTSLGLVILSIDLYQLASTICINGVRCAAGLTVPG